MDSPLMGARQVVRLWSFVYWLSIVKRQSLILGHSKSDWDTPTELDQQPEGLQRCLCPALETIDVPGGKSSWQGIPIGAVG